LCVSAVSGETNFSIGLLAKFSKVFLDIFLKGRVCRFLDPSLSLDLAQARFDFGNLGGSFDLSFIRGFEFFFKSFLCEGE
jgi:hypothetical protein